MECNISVKQSKDGIFFSLSRYGVPEVQKLQVKPRYETWVWQPSPKYLRYSTNISKISLEEILCVLNSYLNEKA